MPTLMPQREEEFQSAVVDLAQKTGWLVAHFRPAKTERGWRTAVSADGAGFVDLVLVRERTLFRELKAERGRLGPNQQRWLDALSTAGADVAVWRPSDWPAIEKTLTRSTT